MSISACQRVAILFALQTNNQIAAMVVNVFGLGMGERSLCALRKQTVIVMTTLLPLAVRAEPPIISSSSLLDRAGAGPASQLDWHGVFCYDMWPNIEHRTVVAMRRLDKRKPRRSIARIAKANHTPSGSSRRS